MGWHGILSEAMWIRITVLGKARATCDASCSPFGGPCHVTMRHVLVWEINLKGRVPSFDSWILTEGI